MELLELFSGTHSIGRAFEEAGCKVTSLDISGEFSPDICTDILLWDYKSAYPPGHFDVLWASPDCSQYSRVKRGPRDLERADALVLKTLEIIRYFRPRFWFIENPATGMLKERSFMQALPCHDLTYCMYGGPGYRKATRIWTNCTQWTPRRVCRGQCGFMEGKRHIATAQKGPERDGRGGTFTRQELYKIPDALCKEIADAVHDAGAQGGSQDGGGPDEVPRADVRGVDLGALRGQPPLQNRVRRPRPALRVDVPGGG